MSASLCLDEQKILCQMMTSIQRNNLCLNFHAIWIGQYKTNYEDTYTNYPQPGSKPAQPQILKQVFPTIFRQFFHGELTLNADCLIPIGLHVCKVLQCHRDRKLKQIRISLKKTHLCQMNGYFFLSHFQKVFQILWSWLKS